MYEIKFIAIFERCHLSGEMRYLSSLTGRKLVIVGPFQSGGRATLYRLIHAMDH